MAALAETGMSSRSIAPVVGVSKSQVAEDVSSSGHLLVEATDNQVEQAITEARADGDLSRANVEQKIAAILTKRYSKPGPRKANRPPLPRVYEEAVRALVKLAGRVERYHFDDRFAANKDSMLVRNRAALLQAHKKLTAICISIGVDTGAEPPLCRECRNRLVIGPPSRVAELAKLAEAERIARGPS